MARTYVKKALRNAQAPPAAPARPGPSPSQGAAPLTAPTGSQDAWGVLQEKVRVLFNARLPRVFPDYGTALAIAMAGAELGVPPVQALGQIYVYEGGAQRQLVQKPGLMAALILQRGLGKITPVGQPTLQSAVVEATRYGVGGRPDETRPFKFDWPTEKGHEDPATDRGWLLARAVAEAARAMFPDAVSGVPYVPEDLQGVSPSAAGATPRPSGPSAATPQVFPSAAPPSSPPKASVKPALTAPASEPVQGPLPVAPAASTAPSETGGEMPATPLAPRVLDHTIWLPDGKGGVQPAKTCGLTREQLEFLISRTTEKGGYEDWPDASAHALAWMALRLPETKLRWLRKEEADELIAVLGTTPQAGVPLAQSEGAGGAGNAGTSNLAPSQGGNGGRGRRKELTPRQKLEAVLALPVVAAHEGQAVRWACAMHKVGSLAELTDDQALRVATDLSEMAKDAEAFGIIIQRASAMA